MEKLETTSTAFFYISKELEKELCGGYINNIQELELGYKEDLLDEQISAIKIKIHKQQTKELIITEKTLFLSEHKMPVLEKTKGLCVFLKKKLYNQKIQEIKQDKNNRVLYFKLDKYYLIFEFFSKSNIILTDLDFVVITSKKQEIWKDREIKTKRKYDFPQTKEITDENSDEILTEIKDKKKEDIIRHLIKEYNLHPWYIEQIYLEKENISQKELIEKIKQIYDYTYTKIKTIDNKDQKIIVCEKSETETDFFKVIEELYLHKNTEETIESKESKQMLKIKNILDTQLETKTEYEKIMSDFEKEGEMIYSYFTLIDQINNQIQIARSKKIDVEIIENKINEYLKKDYPNLSITNIDLKNKTYKLKKEN